MFQRAAKRRTDRIKKSHVPKVASLLAQALSSIGYLSNNSKELEQGGEHMVRWVRPRLRRALILIASLTTALMLMFLAYDRSEAFAVEGTTEADFVKAVVDDTNAYWANELGSLGYPYSPANLAFLYDAPVDSLCGPVYPSEGPLYCRYDATLYYPVNWTVPGGRALDQYGYSAVAFGVAHEIGHHVQEQMD